MFWKATTGYLILGFFDMDLRKIISYNTEGLSGFWGDYK
jgi:hypothetical protein